MTVSITITKVELKLTLAVWGAPDSLTAIGARRNCDPSAVTALDLLPR